MHDLANALGTIELQLYLLATDATGTSASHVTAAQSAMTAAISLLEQLREVVPRDAQPPSPGRAPGR